MLQALIYLLLSQFYRMYVDISSISTQYTHEADTGGPSIWIDNEYQWKGKGTN